MVCKLRVLLRTDPLGQPGTPCWDYTARLGTAGVASPSATQGNRNPLGSGTRPQDYGPGGHRTNLENHDSNSNPPKSTRFRVDYFRQTQ